MNAIKNNETIELSIVLPAYNEGKAIGEAIDRYLTALRHLGYGFEIIVINDGSSDNTLMAAQEIAKNNTQVRVYSNDKNLGVVKTVLRGFSLARGEVVMHNGADLPFDPADTAGVMQKIYAGADVVVVERSNRAAYGIIRKLLSWGNVALIKVLFRSPFCDHNFVQAYRCRVLKAIQVETRGVSTLPPELILKAHTLGFVVERVSANYEPRRSGKSSITLSQIVYTVAELLRLYLVIRQTRKAHVGQKITRANDH